MINSDSCSSRCTSYKNGKTFEQCKEIANTNSNILSKEIIENNEVSWDRVLQIANHDELVYKLTLKYLREKGYDIGNNKIPRIKQ